MKVFLVGIGAGTNRTMTNEVAEAIQSAELIIGAKRMLENLPEHSGAEKIATHAQEILTIIQEAKTECCTVVFSGDTGFYSGVKKLRPLLEKEKYEIHVLPGISSVQILASRLAQPWQDWTLASAHGADCDVLRLLMANKPLFLLTSGSKAPAEICQRLVKAGLGSIRVVVAERLGYEEEKVNVLSAQECAAMVFDPLNVMLIDSPPSPDQRVSGIPDEAFARGNVPMTKQEVRCTILAKLGITPSDVCWDIGGGTGSVSVEMALASKETWSIEVDPEAVELIGINRAKFRAWNMHVVQGDAMSVLKKLPKPDKVFIGGSHGEMKEMIETILSINPKARICVSAIALETLTQAMEAMEKHQMEIEVTQIAISRTKNAGKLHLLMAQNPIFIITGNRTDL